LMRNCWSGLSERRTKNPPLGETDQAHSFMRSRPSSEFVRWSNT
jgi:hypothetical protein